MCECGGVLLVYEGGYVLLAYVSVVMCYWCVIGVCVCVRVVV